MDVGLRGLLAGLEPGRRRQWHQQLGFFASVGIPSDVRLWMRLTLCEWGSGGREKLIPSPAAVQIRGSAPLPRGGNPGPEPSPFGSGPHVDPPPTGKLPS